MADARARRRAPRRAEYTVANIELWGRFVGAVAEDRAGRIVFEYDESFRASGLEISPMHLPLSRRGPQEFPELRRVASFGGLPGVLADALPDAFGNAVIRRYFEQRGAPDAALSPVQKLLYIGSRALGALEFKPAFDPSLSRATDEAIEVARLVTQARRVIEGDVTVAVPEIMQVGASAGGARAKGIILWNRARQRVKSAFAAAEAGDEPWIIKFDGVTEGTGGHELRENVRPGPYGRIEFAYAQLARRAGIHMTPTHLLRERSFAHFMTRRFDRVNGQRLHVHSLGGLHHVDYNVRGAFSYEAYLRTVRRLGLGQPDVDQAFRRMVFNLAAVNQDDHVKNFAFLMGPDGRWALAPAYDLTYAKGNAWTRTHQMTLSGRDDAFTRADLLRLGRLMDVPRDGAAIIDDVAAALGAWRREAEAVDLSRAWIEKVERTFRHFV